MTSAYDPPTDLCTNTCVHTCMVQFVLWFNGVFAAKYLSHALTNLRKHNVLIGLRDQPLIISREYWVGQKKYWYEIYFHKSDDVKKNQTYLIYSEHCIALTWTGPYKRPLVAYGPLWPTAICGRWPSLADKHLYELLTIVTIDNHW